MIEDRYPDALSCLRRPFLAGLLALGMITIVAGCNANLKTATCGWSSNIPNNGTTICQQTYRVLSEIARAELLGKPGLIRQEVTSAPVARRMVSFGNAIRRQHTEFLRVTPTFELTAESHGMVSVGAYLVGKNRAGAIDDPETVTVRSRGSTVKVTGDVAGEQW